MNVIMNTDGQFIITEPTVTANFTRNSTAQDGYGNTVSINQPRFLYPQGNGLMIESGEKLTIPGALIPFPDFTIEFEVYIPSDIADNNHYFFVTVNGSDEIQIYYNSVNGLLYYKVSNAADGSLTYSLATPLVKGEWNRIAYAQDCRGPTAYANTTGGSALISYGKTYLPSNVQNPLPLGVNSSQNNYWLGGQIREFYISEGKRHKTDQIQRCTDGFTVDNRTKYYFPFTSDLYGYIYEPNNVQKNVYVSHDRGNDTTMPYQWLPNIAEMEDGTLVCAYASGADGYNGNEYDLTQSVWMRKSTDKGYTWGDKVNICESDGNYMRGNAGLLIFDYNGTERILLTPTKQKTNVCEQYAKYSDDGGDTWSDESLIGEDLAGVCTPIVLSNGTILLPLYGWHIPFPNTLYAYKSTDGGATWTSVLVSSGKAGGIYDEAAVLELKTNGTYQGKVLYLARSEGQIYYTAFISNDYGATWDNGTLWNTWPSHYPVRNALYRWDANTILCSYTTQASEVIVMVSKDEGATWTRGPVIDNDIGSHHYTNMVRPTGTNSLIVNWCTQGSKSYIINGIIPDFQP